MTQTTHVEKHYGERIGWLRAAVLGANDGIVFTASLVVGVAAAESGRSDILIALSAGGGNFGGSLRRFQRTYGDPAERRSGRAPGEAGR